MIDGRAIALLQKHIRRTGRSLLQYADESFPWTKKEDAGAVAQLHELAAREREAAAPIGQFLVKSHIAPQHLGPYPMFFTTLNYLSLKRLAPLTTEHLQKDAAELERDLARISDGPARELLQQLLEVKKQNIAKLAELAG